MFSHPIRHQLSLLLMFFMAISTARSEQIADSFPESTQWLPGNTLGFALVHDAEIASGKISKLMALFEVPLPAPLALLKITSGLGDGLDLNRDILVAMLADESEERSVWPMILLPVHDYGAFAASIHADASGELCRVTILGEDVLVAKKGSCAMLMNVEHRQPLQRLRARDPKPFESASILRTWLQQNDLAMVLLSKGMHRLLHLGRPGLEKSEQGFTETIRGTSMGKLVGQVHQSFEFYHAIFEATGTQFEAAAVGLAVDDRGNVRVGVRLILDPDLELAQIRMTDPSALMPLVGVTEGPFVVAAGGPMPSGSIEPIVRVTRRIFEVFSSDYGFEDFDENDWHQVEEATRGFLIGVESLSVHISLGREEEPLVGNVHGVLKVADSGHYMESFQKSLELRNRLVSKSTSDIRYEYKVHPVTIGGIEGLDMVADVATAARDPNVPMFDQALQAMLGKEGAMHITMLPLDERTILLAIATKPRVARIMEQIRGDQTENTNGPVESADVQTTLKLLPDEAPWTFLASPRGYLQWLNRWMQRVMRMPHAIPEFPQSPPIGCALHLVDGQLKLDLVLPVKTLRGLAEYSRRLDMR